MFRLMMIILLAKGAFFLSRLRGYQGTTISGTVALRFYPVILEKLAENLKTVIFVTGTNGKTTTSNMLASMMRQSGNQVIHNQGGANMLSGITACMIKAANLMGKVKTDCAVFEVDEGSLPAIIKQVKPSHIVVINFFRDQLDRYGEIDVLIKKIMEAIKPVQTKLILNTDDPLVMQFAHYLQKETIFFGVKPGNLNVGNFTAGESVFCPLCGEKMAYQDTYYCQLGNYCCPCGFSRQLPDYEAKWIQSKPSLSFELMDHRYDTALKGTYNIYNALASMTAASVNGVSFNDIQTALSQYQPSDGRMETFYHYDFPYILNLNKNPSGTNVILEEIMSDSTKKQILIILNNYVADGEDISWLLDVDFEVLNQNTIEQVICSGSRSSELMLRLKYAEITANRVLEIPDIDQAVQYTLAHPLPTYVLPTYTALEKAKKILSREAKSNERVDFV